VIRIEVKAMNQDILLRLLWAAVIIAAGIIIFHLGNRWILYRAGQLPQIGELSRQGIPTLLYFTTPTCAPCKTIQRPAIERLQQLAGDRLQVVEINAASQPEIARQWGVLSVPTTFVLDAAGKPRYVNHGVTPVDKLLKEFEDFSDFSI
jgi:thiol-disulfide isomerase/thioredoxin